MARLGQQRDFEAIDRLVSCPSLRLGSHRWPIQLFKPLATALVRTSLVGTSMDRCLFVERRGWDSNPRKVSLQTISSRSLSTTQPPLQPVLVTNGAGLPAEGRRWGAVGWWAQPELAAPRARPGHLKQPPGPLQRPPSGAWAGRDPQMIGPQPGKLQALLGPQSKAKP